MPGQGHGTSSGAVVKAEPAYGYSMPQQQQAALELLPHQMHPYHVLHGQQMVQVEEELIPLPVPMHVKRNRTRKKPEPAPG